ncbi:MAG: MazG family protein [Defluviitaleaceae bacterium]|nr:MazG family protein [Defluviitaleaceae bacterium]
MTLEDFLGLMDILLGENGCPWDRAQTHESMRQYLLEESYEVIEAINKKDMASLREELGDLLLQVVFHSKLAEKAGEFTIHDVIKEIAHKLVSRHTHVFGEDSAVSAEEVVAVWEGNKAKERHKTPKEAMEAVPKALPALTRAAKVILRSKQSAPEARELIKEIFIKLQFIELEFDKCEKVMLNEEFGKIMLLIVKLAGVLDINAEFSLTNATEEFINTSSPDNSALGGSI